MAKYFIVSGNATLIAIEKPRRVKQINDMGCSKKERDEWITSRSIKMLDDAKKRKQLEIQRAHKAENERKKDINEFLFSYASPSAKKN